MSTNYPGGHQDNSGPYTPPSTGHVTPGYFSPATPPPSQDVPRPYLAPGQQQPPPPVQQHVAPPPAPANYAPAPQHGQYTGILRAIKSYFKQYATFSGRSTRSEFWWMQLILWGLFLAVSIFGTGSDGGLAGFLGSISIFLYVLFVLGTVVPTLALYVRRLHDANMSGGFLALSLVPYAGALIICILAALPSNPRGVRFEKLPLTRPPNYPQGHYPTQRR